MRWRSFFCLILGILLLSSAARAGEAWTLLRSKNFQIIGNAPKTDLQRVAFKLEQFQEAFRRLFPKFNYSQPIPTRVFVFAARGDFTPFKPVRADGATDERIAGYFQPGKDVNHIALTIEGESGETYRTIYHEYVHLLINNNLGAGSVPPWFHEGLAEYFQTFRLEEDRQVFLGEAQKHHLQMLAGQDLIPFETFFGTGNFALHNQGDHGRGVFYAQAWALMHYLQQTEARRAQLDAFLNLILKNKPPREAFQTAFQMDYAAMEKDLKRYIERAALTGTVLTLKEKLNFAVDAQTVSLSEAEANAYLGDLLLHTNRPDEAAGLLQKALKLDESQALAHAALGMTRMKQRRFSEALDHLEKAVRHGNNNYLLHYYYAYALSQETADSKGYVKTYAPEKTAKMRQLLRRAIELNPDFPESYHLLGFINLANDENLPEAIELLEKALAITPGNLWYELEIANVRLRATNYDEAKRIAEKVYAGAADADLRRNALAVLVSVNQIQEQLKRVAHIKEAKKATPHVELSEEEALLQAFNEALRKPAEGEKRVLGFLTQVDCDSRGMIFVVRPQDKNESLRFRASEFKKVRMTTFVAGVEGQNMTCGARKSEDFVVLTSRAGAVEPEVVSIEFVPKYFKFLQ